VDDEQLPLQDGVCAKRDVARCLVGGDPDPRLEPLPFGVDERDERDGRVADLGCEQRKIVESSLGLGIQDPVGAERRETVSFVCIHAEPPVEVVSRYSRCGAGPSALLGLDFDVLYASPIFESTLTGSNTAEKSVTVWTGNLGLNYGGLVGLDIGLTKNGLVLTTSVRHSQTNADTTVYPGTSVPYDPLVDQLGLGWRF
jgi:hypothetical protein